MRLRCMQPALWSAWTSCICRLQRCALSQSLCMCPICERFVLQLSLPPSLVSKLASFCTVRETQSRDSDSLLACFVQTCPSLLGFVCVICGCSPCTMRSIVFALACTLAGCTTHWADGDSSARCQDRSCSCSFSLCCSHSARTPGPWRSARNGTTHNRVRRDGCRASGWRACAWHHRDCG
jgi:hypothetical protein